MSFLSVIICSLALLRAGKKENKMYYNLLLAIFVATCDVREDVKFFLSTREQNRTEINEDNLALVEAENPTFVLIHGWMAESNDTWIIEVTDELLEQGDYNVIAVDYTPIGQLGYVAAVVDSKAIGK